MEPAGPFELQVQAGLAGLHQRAAAVVLLERQLPFTEAGLGRGVGAGLAAGGQGDAQGGAEQGIAWTCHDSSQNQTWADRFAGSS
ncbi:hypothetical protein D3C80_1804740 [compost metagenome]